MIQLFRRYSILAAILWLSPAALWAAGAEQLTLVEDAIEVLNNAQEVPEVRIPKWLLRDAEGIAVVPNVVKAGFVVGGRRGKGLLSIRTQDGSWSNPNFMTLTGGSLGFQAGVQSTDIILVFKSRRSIEDLLRGKFTLGGDASVAAGPVGRAAEAATDIKLKAEIYAYSRSRGLFAGVSLDGTALRIDHRANEAVYAEGITPRRIFAGSLGAVHETLVAFRDQLDKHTADSGN